MSTAASIIVDALARAERDTDCDTDSWCTTLMSGLLATSQLRNALAPRLDAACPLTEKMFVIVAAAPTAWCTARLRLMSPTAAVLHQTPAAFVQLRSISVEGNVAAADISALTAMPASLNQRTLREIAFGPTIAVTDVMLHDVFASVTARLEALIIGSGWCVSDAGLASLRNTPMIATLRKLSLTGSHFITDAGVAALLGPASQLRSLTLAQCTQLSGAFLTQLHEHCHDVLSEIDLSGCESIDNAGAAALCSFRGLTELGLSEAAQLSALPLERLPLLRAVNSGFLYGCSNLTTLDLAALIHVTTIGDNFLSGCSSLTTLDLSGLANATSVGDYFLYGCSDLPTLDLSKLNHVTSVGDSFVYWFTDLTTLDLSGMASLTRVGDYFLGGCSGLTTLDLSQLTHVTEVGGGFLYCCSGLTELDLTGLANVTRVDHGFLRDCSGLKTLDVAPMTYLTIVCASFLDGCVGLSEPESSA